MSEVPRVRTALADTTAAPFLVAALRGAGINPTREQARLLLAQLRFEGLGACNNHNLGNITADDRKPGDFFRPVWFTVDGNPEPGSPWATNRARLLELHQRMLEGKAPRAFRSYPTFDAGAADYVRELQTQFPSILAAAATGDAQATADAIKRSGYTPDAPASLGSTLATIVSEFDARGLLVELPPLGHPAPPPAPPPVPSPTGPSSPSSPLPPGTPPTSASVPGVAHELATVRIWIGDDGARGFTIEQPGGAMHSGPLGQLLPWLNELGLDGSPSP